MKSIWFGLALLVYLQNVACLRILGIFPINGKSHSLIQQTVMKGLAAKGHQVDVYSHFPSKKPIPNYTDISLKGTLPSSLNNMTYEFIMGMRESFSLKNLVSFLGNQQCELLDQPMFQKLLKDKPKYDVVVIEVSLAQQILIIKIKPGKNCKCARILKSGLNSNIFNHLHYIEKKHKKIF